MRPLNYLAVLISSPQTPRLQGPRILILYPTPMHHPASMS